MEYEIQENDKEFIIDNSITKETKMIIERLIEKELNIEINNQNEMYNFINNPEEFIDDKATIEKINELREIIVAMSGIYYA